MRKEQMTMTKAATTKATKAGKKFTAKKVMKILTVAMVMTFMLAAFTMVSSAAAPAAPAGAEGTYQTVIQFFITWLTRIGMLVGLVGAIMFALAIKSNDAEQKQAGLLTMVAGFVVAAVCGAADMFNLFT